MTQQLSRKHLYDLVWSKPMTQLAKEFGLSDNGLRKICKKYDIPMPKMGHWQKVEYGKKISIEKLKYFDKWINTKIIINESESIDEEHYLTKLARRVKEIDEACQKLLPVPDLISKPHYLVKEAKVNLNSQKKITHWSGLPQCICTGNNLLSISVQKHNVKRTLRLIDTFIKMVELRGHKVLIVNNSTILDIDEEKYKLRFREKHTRQDIPDERWATTELVPNDKLSIKFDHYSNKEWIDRGTLLEEQLTRVLAFFELKSVQDKEQREHCRVAREKADIQREIDRKLQARRDWEAKKEVFLITRSKEWNKAEELKKLISRIENSKDLNQKTIDWLEWANQQVDKLNPLSNGINSFIAEFDFPEYLKE